MRERFDLILVGTGLANGLIACRLRQRRPDLRLLLLEGGEAPGGNHTWSFHEHDLSVEEAEWLRPFVAHRWPGYDVRFPARRRTLETGYRSVTSEGFAELLQQEFKDDIRVHCAVASVEPEAAILADGTRIKAKAVLDGRGYRASRHIDLGFQKFLGREIRLEQPHGLAHPIVMDATVPQHDGYRFVYVLPFDERRLLVEDTYYADGSALDPDALRRRIEAYGAARGWRVDAVLREEHGILPIALDGDIDRYWADRGGVAASGLSALLFHPTTGYSLPDAVRLADRIATSGDLSGPGLFALCRDFSVTLWRERSFFRRLNRMLYFAGAPDRRFEILQHFHRLPEDVIARFYAARLTGADKVRILAGRPPVPIAGALKALLRPRKVEEEPA